MLAFFYKTISMFEQRCHILRGSNQPFSKDYYLQGILQTLLVSHVQVFEILSLNNKEIDELNVQLSKLELIKEARSTLEELNREHMEKLRQQKEEADMFLRIQMEQKMELTRQQKKEVEDIQKTLQNKLRINIDSKLHNYNQPPPVRTPSTNDDIHDSTRHHFPPPPNHHMAPFSAPIHKSENPFPYPTSFHTDQTPVYFPPPPPPPQQQYQQHQQHQSPQQHQQHQQQHQQHQSHHPHPRDIPFYAGQNIPHFYAYPPGETATPMGRPPQPNPYHQVRPPMAPQNQNNSDPVISNYATPPATAEYPKSVSSNNSAPYPEHAPSNKSDNISPPVKPQAPQEEFEQATNEAPTEEDPNDSKSKLIDFDS